jgi:hypothetical protein
MHTPIEARVELRHDAFQREGFLLSEKDGQHIGGHKFRFVSLDDHLHRSTSLHASR